MLGVGGGGGGGSGGAVIDNLFSKAAFDVRGERSGGRGLPASVCQSVGLTGENIWQERIQLLKPIQVWWSGYSPGPRMYW